MDNFLLIDGHALIYRAYHAYPELTAPDGRLINAVFGFSRILLTSLRDQEPEYLAVAFDHKGPTFRHEAYQEYKAHRAEMPDDLKPQIEIIKEVVAALNIPIFEMAGYEADDLVGTLARQAGELGEVQTVIVSGDKDLLQLVTDSTSVFIPGRGKWSHDVLYDDIQVEKKMGVAPEQVIDLKGLMGDSSDNIPGVKGVGAKTATRLLEHFTTLEKLYQHLDAVDAQTNPKQAVDKDKGLTASVINKLLTDRDKAFMSRELATINTQVPIELDLPACRVRHYDKEVVSELFESLDFASLMPLLPDDAFEGDVQDALF